MIKRAVILAGGLNTRVSELTQGRIPKILIPIGSSTILDHIIENLMLLGIREFYLGIDAKHQETIEQHLRRYDRPQFSHYGHFYVVPESKPLGTGGGLLNVLDFGRSDFDDGFCLVNGDGLVMPKYLDLTDSRNQVVVCWHENPDGAYGVFETSLSGHVISFKSKGGEAGWINCGMYVIRDTTFFRTRGDMRKHQVHACSFEDDLLPSFIKQCGLHAYLLDDVYKFIDWGTTELIKEYQGE
jgi:NDP-sugar pyrophosphorylase family protein